MFCGTFLGLHCLLGEMQSHLGLHYISMCWLRPEFHVKKWLISFICDENFSQFD